MTPSRRSPGGGASGEGASGSQAKKPARAKKAKKAKRTKKARSSAGSSGAAEAPVGGVLTTSALVEAATEADLADLHRFWTGGAEGGGKPAALREEVLACMAEPERVQERVGALGQRQQVVFQALLSSPGHELPHAELAAHKQLSYLSAFDLEAAITELGRYGLVGAACSREVLAYGMRAHAIPADLADQLARHRRGQERGVFDVFALRGHLERMNASSKSGRRIPPERQRSFYKMYSSETGCVARIERLPDGLRPLVEKVILEFGGVLSKDLFDRMEHDLPSWNGRRWSKQLEENLVGTVERLDLGHYGLNHDDETLIVFNEVALAWLKRVAVPGDPDRPREEASLGVDLASNISRFLGYILDHQVRFTVRGEIFKTTEKRILQELIPNPGRELAREEVLAFIYGFCRHGRLIESTGERTFSLGSSGREWEPRSLEEKLQTLLDYTVEERGLGGEYFHQLQLRRIYLRLLKRIEVGVWYDLMYLPFLARNTYLSNLDELAVEDYFRAGIGGGGSGGQEDLQRLAWNLVGWVRRRLYLLGLIDLGYDGHGRPVAMRLTKTGARLLGVASESSEAHVGIGSLIVAPDFEVVLFATGDDASLVHDLDRFCEREKSGELIHFRITEKSVQRALSEGMFLTRIEGTLVQNSRTPVPQNVLFTLRSWAAAAGMMRLDQEGRLTCEDSATFERLVSDPGVKPHISRVLDEHTVRLKRRATPLRLQALLRELNYLVELEE